MKSAIAELEAKGKAAKKAAHRLAYLATDVKNQALRNIADDLSARKDEIIAANQVDYKAGEASGMGAAMLDRLMLDTGRLEAIASDVLTVAALPDPVGEVMDMRTMTNGLQLGKKRVPLGVIGAIYESRPNVTIDISVLCLKSGNAIILRGGKEAIHSNTSSGEARKPFTPTPPWPGWCRKPAPGPACRKEPCNSWTTPTANWSLTCSR